jgi:glycosyltransferase involved in cell wall biosynthesis
MKYKIHVYVVCWNENDIVPFVVDYWKQYAEKVVVCDNGSTDGTIEYLKHYSWIEIRHFETEGLDDTMNMKIKNTCWKESKGKADFVVVSDFDECLYSPVLEQELEYMKEHNMTICGPEQYALCGDSYPQYEDGKFIHELVRNGYIQKSNHSFDVSGKIMLFDPNLIEEMNYGPGCHTCNPTGDVKLYDRKHIFCIHTNKGFGFDYKIKRYKEMRERLSDNNKRHGYGTFYLNSEQKIKDEYLREMSRRIDILNEIINKEKQ